MLILNEDTLNHLLTNTNCVSVSLHVTALNYGCVYCANVSPHPHMYLCPHMAFALYQPMHLHE